MIGQAHTDRSRKGDYWEYFVILNAWERGAEVYKNVGCTGKTDLIIVSDGKILEVDVKVLCQNKPGYYGTNSRHSKAKKPVVVVHPVTKEIRWIRGKEPKGWENFWD